MKAYNIPYYFRLAILSILVVIIIPGCSTTRGIEDNQAIVRKLTVKGVDKDFADAAVLHVDKEQQPNNWLNLQFYYLFSKKGKKNIGEAPRLLDSNLVEFSRLQIQKFLQNKGYVKAKVTDSIIVKNKKAELVFTANQGPLFHIRNFKDSIADPKVQKLYRETRQAYSHVNTGSRFDTDSLAYDRDQFYQVMKRNGYYDFYRQYINYLPDSSYNKSIVDVVMTIDNPLDKPAHPIYTINNTLITITKSNGRTDGKADTIQVDSQYRFVDYSGRFKPHTVTDYSFQRKGDIYDIDKQTLTTSRLSELNVFRNVPSPTYTKLSDSTNRLNTRLDITPLKQMSDRVEAEFLFNQGRYGYNLGNTFTNRNLFKEAAILQVKLNWSVLFDNGRVQSDQKGVQNQEIKAGVSLIYPRIVSPFDFPNLAKFGVPHTTFSTSASLFYQKGLVERRSFVTAVTYDFFETYRKQHSVTPISIEFASGNIDPIARRALLDSNRYSYVYLIGRTTFTSGSQYTFQYNANELNSYKDFMYFRGGLDLGGGLLSLLSKLANTKKDSLGQRTFFGYTFAQYVKTELDLRLYNSLGGERQFIFRINPGIGIPYGNSTQLIFEKNFYTGGANDIRAWLPRTLGPGQFNRAVYGNDVVQRSRLKYLDQFGEIKIVANAEYRYKAADNFFGTKLKGAFFMDAGNVWRLHKQVENPGGEFRFNNILQSTAIGVGTGLRFDLGFFIFRLDAAFKFKDPQFQGSDQWVLIKHFGELFRAGDFKKNYVVTNGENYNFMQLNFGIGLPF